MSTSDENGGPSLSGSSESSEANAGRAAYMAFLRGQSGPEAVTRAALESLAAGLYCSPAFLFFFSLDGLLAVKYPRVAPTASSPPPPVSFPGVVAAAGRHAATCSARSLAFVVVANTLAAGGREMARLGPRFAENDVVAGVGPQGGVEKMAALGFAAGSMAAILLTADWARDLGRGRRGVYVAMGGMAGVMMPLAIARIGPTVKRAFARLVPAPVG